MSHEPIIASLQKLQLSQERTREWIAKQPLDEEELESIAESSVVDSGDDSGDYGTDTDREEEVSTVALGTQVAPNNVAIAKDTIRDLMNSINSVQTVGDVNITNSTNVHIGNVTNFNGDIQIFAGDCFGDHVRRRNTRKERRKATSAAKQQNVDTTYDEEEDEERVRDDAFITEPKFKIPKELCSIVPRSSWLAQKPMEDYQYMEEPVKFVVISHTATESSKVRAINIRLIRDIQCFHIESRLWNDIAYNFLIGCDGNIYMGRGWGVVGAHTLGYNKRAIGISFIGCFMRELPSQTAMNMCKNLLARGVEQGHLAHDYKLICHCQCNSTESPGRRLYEEIQTWDHFFNLSKDEQ